MTLNLPQFDKNRYPNPFIPRKHNHSLDKIKPKTLNFQGINKYKVKFGTRANLTDRPRRRKMTTSPSSKLNKIIQSFKSRGKFTKIDRTQSPLSKTDRSHRRTHKKNFKGKKSDKKLSGIIGSLSDNKSFLGYKSKRTLLGLENKRKGASMALVVPADFHKVKDLDLTVRANRTTTESFRMPKSKYKGNRSFEGLNHKGKSSLGLERMVSPASKKKSFLKHQIPNNPNFGYVRVL